MSGGHWDYQSHRIEDALNTISEDEIVRTRWPVLGKLLQALGQELAKCEHDMDWDISGDSSIKDDAAWERERLGAILEATMKAAPDEWFPRGKWATIQAVQGRMGEPPNNEVTGGAEPSRAVKG